MASVACSACSSKHKRKCSRSVNVQDVVPPVIAAQPSTSSSTTHNESQILTVLNSLQASMGRMESRIVHLETDAADSISDVNVSPIVDDIPIPSMDTLRNSAEVQREVQARIALLQKKLH